MLIKDYSKNKENTNSSRTSSLYYTLSNVNDIHTLTKEKVRRFYSRRTGVGSLSEFLTLPSSLLVASQMVVIESACAGLKELAVVSYRLPEGIFTLRSHTRTALVLNLSFPSSCGVGVVDFANLQTNHSVGVITQGQIQLDTHQQEG